MSFKTILVHIDDTKHTQQRIQLAAELALQYQAHLIGVADTGAARFIYQDGNINGVDPSLLSYLDYLHQRATQNIADFNLQVSALGVASHASEITQDDVAGGIGHRARYSDLVIVGQTDPELAMPAVMDNFPEYLVLHSGRPILIIPYAGSFSHIGKRPMIAWDGSRAATRAITDAIPLLQQAQLVQLVSVNPKENILVEPPATSMAAYLERHGINLEISHHHSTVDIGNALLSLSADLDADLIIMGGYGHSRFRELIMGGATRTILKCMTVPVFMSH